MSCSGTRQHGTWGSLKSNQQPYASQHTSSNPCATMTPELNVFLFFKVAIFATQMKYHDDDDDDDEVSLAVTKISRCHLAFAELSRIQFQFVNTNEILSNALNSIIGSMQPYPTRFLPSASLERAIPACSSLILTVTPVIAGFYPAVIQHLLGAVSISPSAKD